MTDSQNMGQEHSSDNETPKNKTPFTIVALGASAGGLESLEKFFLNIPPDSGMAFIVVVHLDPQHKTMLPGLLARYTQMTTCLVEDGTKVEPNTVYIIPPNHEMTIHDYRLQLDEALKERGVRHTIDKFLTSLAADAGARSVAIILSGTGTDGTTGIKDINSAGGVVIAEDEKSSKYPGMPSSAIDSGLVDLVLCSENMGEKLIELSKNPLFLRDNNAELNKNISDNLKKIFQLVHRKTGHDFSHYKTNTMIRRIDRHMFINNISRIDHYISRLENNSEECQGLFKEVLISVTSFFRDPEAFRYLEKNILPKLLENQTSGRAIRIWLAGCATGEEAYSLAMMIKEYQHDHQDNSKIQIFASDIDHQAIDYARKGIYPQRIASEVGQQRLDRFFNKRGNHYEIGKQIREMVIFAHHNLIKDPPFSRLDMVICRNLMIYLNPDIQKRIIPLFYQILRPGGILFLGTSESIGRHTDLFTPLSKKWKLFVRQLHGPKLPVTMNMGFAQSTANMPQNKSMAKTDPLDPGEIAERLLVQRYSPPCVVINRKNEILYYSTRTARYLEPPVGKPTHDILAMVHEDLRPALRAAIHKVHSSHEAAEYRDLSIKHENNKEIIHLRVEPITNPPAAKDLSLVIFERAGQPLITRTDDDETLQQAEQTEKDQIIAQLEDQLHATQEELQSTIERLESANEELKSSNEELMSMNEEFQSANEELETSKEELQALNEELVTVNAELERKVEELGEANDDLQNLLASSEIATIFLNKQLQVKRFTPQMADLFNLIESDIGRPLQHLTGKIIYPDLEKDAERVLTDLAPVERELPSVLEDRHFLMRMLPYRTAENQTGGVVVTFTDITHRLHAEENHARLAAIVESTNDAVIGEQMDGTITSWNEGAERIYGYNADEMIGKTLEPIIPQELRKEREDIVSRLKQGEQIRNLETERICKGGDKIQISVSISPIYNYKGEITATATIARDISLQKKQQQQLIESERLQRSRAEELEALMEAVPAAVWIAKDPECKTIDGNRTSFEILRLERNVNPSKSSPDGGPQNFRIFQHGRELSTDELPVQMAARTGQSVNGFEEEIVFDNGRRIHIYGNASPLLDEQGKPRGAVAAFIDITQLKKMEESLRQAEKMQAIGQLAGGIAHDFNNQLSGVLGFADLLLNKADNPDISRYAQNIKFSAMRSADLTQQLLAFSRKGTLINQPVNIHTLLKDIENILEHSLDKRIEIIHDLKARPEITIGDPTHLQSCLLNIAINARDAMPEGGTLSFITTTEKISREFCEQHQDEIEAGAYIAIHIADTGTGIEERILPKIFEPFFTTKKTGEGTGMGLSSAYGTVRRHGGFVDVKSKIGEGTTFTIFLPLPAGEDESLTQKGQEQEPIKGEGRILLVDDEEMVRNIATEMLTDLGYQVLTCANGEEAIEYYHEHSQQIDLIILDMIMPKMNGYDTFIGLRRINPEVLVILATGYSTDGLAKTILAEGCRTIIKKPFHMAELSKTIADVLNTD